MQRAEIWWAALSEPAGSGPGYRRPVLIVQADEFNRSNIQTVLVAVISSNTSLAGAPGNVLLKRKHSSLPRDSVVNVSQVITVDKALLTERVSRLGNPLMAAVDAGLKLVLDV